MIAWKGNTGAAGLVPHLSYVKRKLEPLGGELKTVCDGSTGPYTHLTLALAPMPDPNPASLIHSPLILHFVIPLGVMLYLEIQEGKKRMGRQKYVGENGVALTLLPKALNLFSLSLILTLNLTFTL